MRPGATPDVSTVKTLEDLRRYVAIYLGQIDQILKGNVQFGDNTKSQIISVNFQSANTEIAVRHNLTRIPLGYIVVSSSAAMNLYDGVNNNTTDFIYLKSSATGTARVLLIT